MINRVSKWFPVNFLSLPSRVPRNVRLKQLENNADEARISHSKGSSQLPIQQLSIVGKPETVTLSEQGAVSAFWDNKIIKM